MTQTLETDRLRLSVPTPDMFDHVADFLGSDRAAYVGGPMHRYQAWNSFCAQLGHWQLRGYGLFAVTDSSDGALCGMIGLYNPDGWLAPEIGWWITNPAKEGKGIAMEAALRARSHAYDTIGWTEAFSVIAPDNTRSIALAERMGATLDRRDVTPTGKPALIYRHPTPAEAA